MNVQPTRWTIAMLLGAATVACAGDPEVGFGAEEAAVEVITEPAFEEGFFPATTVVEGIPGDAVARHVDIAKLEAAREDWVNRGHENYSYRAVLLTETLDNNPPPSDCGAVGGTIAVEVVNGEVVTAFVLEEACSIDIESPSRPPLTGEEIYTFAIELGEQSGGAEFALGEQSFPQLIFVEGPDGFMQFELFEFDHDFPESVPVGSDVLEAELDAARTLWARVGIDDYRIEVEEGGELGSDEYRVEALFDIIAQHLDDGASSVLVQFNPTNGIPIGIALDGEPDLRVLSFIPTAAQDVDLVEVLAALGANNDDAPADALTLGDARFCGLDRSNNEGGLDGDPIARRCLTSGYERGIPSVLIQSALTIEGAPLILVLKVDSESVTEFLDSSQDPLASFGWHERTCSGPGVIRPISGLLEGFNLDC